MYYYTSQPLIYDDTIILTGTTFGASINDTSRCVTYIDDIPGSASDIVDSISAIYPSGCTQCTSGSTPTPTPTITVTTSPSVTPTLSSSVGVTVTPTISLTPTITVSPTLTPSVTPSTGSYSFAQFIDKYEYDGSGMINFSSVTDSTQAKTVICGYWSGTSQSVTSFTGNYTGGTLGIGVYVGFSSTPGVAPMFAGNYVVGNFPSVSGPSSVNYWVVIDGSGFITTYDLIDSNC